MSTAEQPDSIGPDVVPPVTVENLDIVFEDEGVKDESLRVPGITFTSFASESQLPSIMALVEKDLSEPYSVFTYRYFVLGWKQLTILATDSEDPDKLTGVIVCKVDRVNTRKRLRGYIAMLAVDKDQRKRGIGRSLATRAILRMKAMGCDEVVLETEYTNTGALFLYESLGFVRNKRMCKYYLNGNDAFRLKLWFTSPSWDDPVVAPQEELKEKSTESSTQNATIAANREEEASGADSAATQ